MRSSRRFSQAGIAIGIAMSVAGCQLLADDDCANGDCDDSSRAGAGGDSDVGTSGSGTRGGGTSITDPVAEGGAGGAIATSGAVGGSTAETATGGGGGTNSLASGGTGGTTDPMDSGGVGGTFGTSTGGTGGSATGGSGTSCAWKSLGTNQPAGYVTDVAFDPRQPAHVYVAAGPHLYRSVNAGNSFERIASVTPLITDIGFPADAPAVLLASSVSGLLRSDDSGRTWRTHALSGLGLSTLLVHPADSRLVVVAVDSVGLLRSTDGGDTWMPADNGLPHGVFNAILGDPSDSQRILVNVDSMSAAEGQLTTQLESLDAGATWTPIFPTVAGQARGLAACAADFDNLVAGAGSKLVLSRDGGRTWTDLSLGRSPITTNFVIGGSDCQTIYVADLISSQSATLWRSLDGGTTFTGPHLAGTEMLHSPYSRKMELSPEDPKHLFATMAAGLFETRNGANQFSLVSNVGIPQVRQMASLDHLGEIWAATWGAGLWRWTRASNEWTAIPTPTEVPDTLLSVSKSPHDPNHVVVGGWVVNAQTRDAGKTFTIEGKSNTVYWTAFAPDDPQLVLSTSDGLGVIRSTNGGSAPWAAYNSGLVPFGDDVPGFKGGYFTRAVAFDAQGNAYLGGERQGVSFLARGDATWVSLSGKLAKSNVRCLLSMSDATYACTDALGVARIDIETRQIDLLTSGLQNLNVTGLVANGDEVIATTGKGVYRLRSDGTWIGLGSSCLQAEGTGAPVIFHDGGQAMLAVMVGQFGVHYTPL